MNITKTISEHSTQIKADVEAYRSTFETAQSFSSGVEAARAGYGEKSVSISDVLKANNSLPPTSDHGIEY